MRVMDGDVRSIILDIEGTTTPVEFVYDVLFPHASEQSAVFLAQHWSDHGVQRDIAGLRDEHARDLATGLEPPAWEIAASPLEIMSIAAYVRWLISRDRKTTALKSLQGKIWRAGYEAGLLRAEIYDDVPPALDRWTRSGVQVGVFSSGSVLAQRLLFAHTTAGDLTVFLSNYFDTTIGSKFEVGSYRHISGALDEPAPAILFVSDVVAELDAAKTAGMKTTLCVRPGRLIDRGDHPAVATFDSICP